MITESLASKIEKAESGDVHAMYDIVRAVRHGDGCKPDPAAELKWILRAADNAHPEALLDLAFRYAFGRGVPKDADKERDCYEKIIAGNCEGFPGAEYTLGAAKHVLATILFERRAPADYTRAATLMRESLELHGYKYARNEYAVCLMLGLGIAQDISKGMGLLQASAEAGNAVAREMLQKGIVRGCGQIMAAGLKPLWDEGKQPYYRIVDLRDTPHKGAGKVSPPVTEMPVGTQPARAKNTGTPAIGASEAQQQLDGLIGLAGAKQQVKTLLNRQRLDSLRREQGLPATEMNLHLVFTGSPGTGKTTVARLLGAILCEAGLLEKGHVVEVSNHDLIGEWVGTSSPRVVAKVQEAMGGILFIDEAYNLITAIGASGASNSFSMNAITTLVQLMENHKGKFMVIAAGYAQEMREFIDFNPGLQSRFREIIHFDDLTDAELAQVYTGYAAESKYILAEGCREVLEKVMHDAPARHARTFGNARFVRNLFEETLERVANRLAHVTAPTLADLTTITAFDIKAAADDFMRQDALRRRQG